MLFDPARHEPLNGPSWSEAAARKTLEDIASEARASFDKEHLFPAHPMDEPSHRHMGSGFYYGAAGVLWALDYLRRQSVFETEKPWLVENLTSLLSHFAREAEGRGPLADTTSFLFGDLPVLLHLLTLTGQQTWRNQALERIASSTKDPVRELMWGTPGVLVLTRLIVDTELAAAAKPHDQVSLGRLLEAWNFEEDDLYLWHEELYGSRRLVLGTVHGFFGQVLPLLQRLDDMPDDLRLKVLDRTRDVLCRTACRGSGLANWPVMLGKDGEGRDLLLHYCHGAPGIVISACEFPADLDTEVDRLLIEGGDLIWHAGPLRKGANLCHGTAGNGYTFLKLFARSGDELWLDRARKFAMHGIAQYEQARRDTGHGRFSLWTGDPGFALFLWSCLNADERFPTIDVF